MGPGSSKIKGIVIIRNKIEASFIEYITENYEQCSLDFKDLDDYGYGFIRFKINIINLNSDYKFLYFYYARLDPDNFPNIKCLNFWGFAFGDQLALQTLEEILNDEEVSNIIKRSIIFNIMIFKDLKLEEVNAGK